MRRRTLRKCFARTESCVRHHRKRLILASDTSVKSGVPVTVRNSMAWPRSETVEMLVQTPASVPNISVQDEQNHLLVSQILQHDAGTNTYDLIVNVPDVPALGYKVVHVADYETAVNKRYGSAVLCRGSDSPTKMSSAWENLLISFEIDRHTGCITKITSASGKMQFVAADTCGNQLQPTSTPRKTTMRGTSTRAHLTEL